MTRTEQILRAISDGLRAGPGNVRLFLAILLGGIAVIVIALAIQRGVARRRQRARLHDRFQQEIRRLDLTVREVDILHLLAAFLADPAKRYLLLTNRYTFRHAAHMLGPLDPPLDLAFRELEGKLGFAESHRAEAERVLSAPAVGSAVTIEPSYGTERALALVHSRDGETLHLELQSPLRLSPGMAVHLLAPHPTAVLETTGTVTEAGEWEVSVRMDRLFQEVVPRRFGAGTLKTLIRHEGAQRSDLRAAELISIWPSGAVLDCDGMVLRRGEDIQIVLRRDHAHWASVNASVSGVRRRGHRARVRFSHLSKEARRAILG